MLSFLSCRATCLPASACALLFCLGCLPSNAAPVLPEPANIPKAEPQTEFPRPQDPDVRESPRPAMSAPAGDETVRIQVDAFLFSGNDSISSAELAETLSDLVGRKLGIQDLKQATNRITLLYRQRGFMLAQAYLPEQEIRDNRIEITVIEGRLGALEFQAEDGLDAAFLAEMAGRQLSEADTIRENNLIRNVTLLNSLPGIKAAAQLNPGERIGTSDASIAVSAEPRWAGMIGANTFGNRYTGREVLNATAMLNNPAGRGDQLALQLRSSNHERQRGIQFNYLLPLHPSGTLLNLSYSHVDYRLSGEFSALKASGDSDYLSAGIDQPLLRSRPVNITGRATLSHKDINDEVATFALKNRRNIKAAELGLYADRRDRTSRALSQIGVNLKAGHVDFRDRVAQSLDDGGAETAGDFLKYNLFVSRAQPLSQKINLNLHAEYQGANKNLDGSEKLSIGGVNRWRAFAELPTSADRGWVAGMELRGIYGEENFLASFLRSTSVSPYVFYDAGLGIINHEALDKNNHVRSTHAGLGMDAAIGERWYYGLAWSWQKRDVDGSESEREHRMWGQLQMTF